MMTRFWKINRESCSDGNLPWYRRNSFDRQDIVCPERAGLNRPTWGFVSQEVV